MTNEVLAILCIALSATIACMYIRILALKSEVAEFKKQVEREVANGARYRKAFFDLFDKLDKCNADVAQRFEKVKASIEATCERISKQAYKN